MPNVSAWLRRLITMPFFPPDQYGVVDPADADWVEELAAKALEREVPVDVAAGRALT